MPTEQKHGDDRALRAREDAQNMRDTARRSRHLHSGRGLLWKGRRRTLRALHQRCAVSVASRGAVADVNCFAAVSSTANQRHDAKRGPAPAARTYRCAQGTPSGARESPLAV